MLYTYLSLKTNFSIIVTGHLYNTLHTSTYFRRLSNQRPTTRSPQSTVIYGNLPFSTIFRYILLYSTKFC
jgi:hypothetical protein